MMSKHNSIMKGRAPSLSSVLDRLAIPSPEAEGPSASGFHFQSEMKGTVSSLSPPDKLSISVNMQQGHGGNKEPRSVESLTGFSMHETRAVAESRQPECEPCPGTDDSQESKNSLPFLILHKIDESLKSTDHQNSSLESNETSDDSSGTSSLSLNPKSSKLKSISSMGRPVSEKGVDRTNMERAMSTSGSVVSLKTAKTMTQPKECHQGFMFGTNVELSNYLSKIVFSQRESGGIYVFDKLNPSCKNRVRVYRPKQEFKILKDILQLKDDCGVFLCQDIISNDRFILKKIMKSNHRLVGTEFLTKHSQPFLPKIYGVYKEENTISIFQEIIEGCTLMDVDWNLPKIRQLAEVLLLAVEYLHSNDLVHSDIKLRNLMVRDPCNPQTLVLIDFESAKHPSYPFIAGGHTPTYLPPWHERFMNLEKYDPILKTADLWAVACVITFFLMPVDRSENDGLWNQFMNKIKRACSNCSRKAEWGYCKNCRKSFLSVLKEHGHRLLELHLGNMMDKSIEEPDWQALKCTLKYLTDTTNIAAKHVSIALGLIRGTEGFNSQPDTEGDYDVNP